MSAGRTIAEGTIDPFAGLTDDFSDVHMDAEVMESQRRLDLGWNANARDHA